MKPSGKILPALVCLLVMFAIVTALPGCGGKKEIVPVAVGELQSYRDPGFGFSIHFPKDWVKDTQVGRAHFYNADGVNTKFLEPTGNYPDGVVIAVDVTRTQTPADEQKRLVGEMKTMGMQINPEEAVTVGGKSGTKISYTAQYTKKIGVKGYHIFVQADSLLYDIGAAGFGDLYEIYAKVLDASIASFEFPKPVEKGADPTLPSEAFTNNDAKLFSFDYPDNFNFVNIPKGNNELAIGLRGVRQDCSVLFHVFPAKGLTLEKVFDQNKGKYAGASAGKTTLGGQPAMSLTYTAARDVERRFIFAVKNDKVYRVTLDWFKPQREKYLAAYDKVLSSFKFK
jgi:hypothetical protein